MRSPTPSICAWQSPRTSTAYLDTDGCPDPDNDADLVADTNDKCPLAPEDPDGFEDADGCPDEDNDLDGFSRTKLISARMKRSGSE